MLNTIEILALIMALWAVELATKGYQPLTHFSGRASQAPFLAVADKPRRIHAFCHLLIQIAVGSQGREVQTPPQYCTEGPNILGNQQL